MQKNKKVLLLGASGDIGMQILLKLVEQKTPVLAVTHQNAHRIQKISSLSPLLIVKANLLNGRGIKTLLKKSDRFQPNIIINAMGLCSFRKFEDTPSADITNSVRINFLSPCLIFGHIIARMPKTDRLKILNLSSFAADVNPPGLSIYSSTKLALENLVQNIQQESFNKVLTCNLVLGPVASQMLQNIVDKKAKSFFEKSVQNAMKKKLQKTEPLSAESVARLAIDLLERDPWVTRCVANRELMTEINASRLAVRGLEVVYEPT